MKQGNFFILDNNIFYYDDNSNIKSINFEGKKNDSEYTKINLNKIYEKNIMQEATNNNQINKKIKEFKNTGKYIFLNNMLLTKDLKTLSYFFKEIKKDNKTHSIEYYNYSNFLSNYSSMKLLRYDNDNNVYIRCLEKNNNKAYLYVFNKLGQKLISFNYDDLKDTALKNGNRVWPAVSPNGDIYFMRSDESGTYFWKVERQW